MDRFGTAGTGSYPESPPVRRTKNLWLLHPTAVHLCIPRKKSSSCRFGAPGADPNQVSTPAFWKMETFLVFKHVSKGKCFPLPPCYRKRLGGIAADPRADERKSSLKPAVWNSQMLICFIVSMFVCNRLSVSLSSKCCAALPEKHIVSSPQIWI